MENLICAIFRHKPPQDYMINVNIQHECFRCNKLFFPRYNRKKILGNEGYMKKAGIMPSAGDIVEFDPQQGLPWQQQALNTALETDRLHEVKMGQLPDRGSPTGSDLKWLLDDADHNAINNLRIAAMKQATLPKTTAVKE